MFKQKSIFYFQLCRFNRYFFQAVHVLSECYAFLPFPEINKNNTIQKDFA